MVQSPLLSICILNWNRKDDIVESIRNIFECHFKGFEIILVDNQSSDGSVDAVRSLFPEVIIINNENNGIAGWNKAFSQARGQYLLALDNDAHPKKDALGKLVSAFTEHNEVGIIACNIVINNKGKEQSAFRHITTSSNEIQETYDFIGCGVAIRKEVFTAIGGFADFIFMYGHETEYSIRAMSHGFRIFIRSDIIVYHRVSPASRSSGMSIKYCVSNFIITAWLYMPFLYALNISFALLIECLVLAISSNNLLSYFSGLKRILTFIPYILKRRNTITWELTSKIDKHFPFTIWHLTQRVFAYLTK